MLTKMAIWELLKINVTYIKAIQTLINFPKSTFSEFWNLRRAFCNLETICSIKRLNLSKISEHGGLLIFCTYPPFFLKTNTLDEVAKQKLSSHWRGKTKLDFFQAPSPQPDSSYYWISLLISWKTSLARLYCFCFRFCIWHSTHPVQISLGVLEEKEKSKAIVEHHGFLTQYIIVDSQGNWLSKMAKKKAWGMRYP